MDVKAVGRNSKHRPIGRSKIICLYVSQMAADFILEALSGIGFHSFFSSSGEAAIFSGLLFFVLFQTEIMQMQAKSF